MVKFTNKYDGSKFDDNNYTYLFLSEFEELRDEVYDFLPCCSSDDSIPDRLSIKEITSKDTTFRINPRSVMFPELLEQEYA